MKTGCWSTYKGRGRVGISRGAPRFIAPPGYRRFMALAPTADMHGLPYEEYVECYARVLAMLDPRLVWEQIHALTGYSFPLDYGAASPATVKVPVEPVLMCFERPVFTRENYCHRRMVAKWLGAELGVDIPEIEV